ncbi:hypothetical protein L873DRAFT_1828189 [Choiromyces venosus 120613-1]|uniref:Integral membrane protein, Mpv17/PMP22 family n=1 Tax=Choiromyces venosus 120613-1 TaxID=1336337 RepID=A0A3N4JS87_9PEZI|nr:hypothetical protein L873DRAFT_1828189 [Choiromyces venosus 120613-1]
MSAIVNASIQAALLSAFSNILAQSLQAYKSNTSLSFDFAPACQFALYALLSTPPNFVWQEWLEAAFPANVPVTINGKETEKNGDTAVQTRMSKSNTLWKFLLDQFLGGPVNNVLFLAAMAGFRGLPMEGVVQHVRAEFIPLSLASYKLWPLVSIIAFVFVPVERRLLFGGLVALGWNVYLSLLMAG